MNDFTRPVHGEIQWYDRRKPKPRSAIDSGCVLLELSGDRAVVITASYGVLAVDLAASMTAEDAKLAYPDKAGMIDGCDHLVLGSSNGSYCSFCGKGYGEVELVLVTARRFQSQPASICIDCFKAAALAVMAKRRQLDNAGH